MIRATTPVHSFLFEEDPSPFEQILITYSQGGEIVLEKTKADLEIEEIEEEEIDPKHKERYRASFRLTQEETNLFEANTAKPVYVQVRILTEAGEAIASEKWRIPLKDVLNDEVMS